jgi:hypothetical protein
MVVRGFRWGRMVFYLEILFLCCVDRQTHPTLVILVGWVDLGLYAAKTSLSLLVNYQGFLQFLAIEVYPEGVGEVHFGVGQLP